MINPKAIKFMEYYFAIIVINMETMYKWGEMFATMLKEEKNVEY